MPHSPLCKYIFTSTSHLSGYTNIVNEVCVLHLVKLSVSLGQEVVTSLPRLSNCMIVHYYTRAVVMSLSGESYVCTWYKRQKLRTLT